MGKLIDVDEAQELEDANQKIEYRLDDRFVINDGKKHFFAVICPGGGYERVCSFIEGTPIARKLNELGISAFIVYYRCKTRFPAPMDDLARAIGYILDHAEKYNLEADNYSLWGASAGGHLAASFGTEKLGWKKYNLQKPAAIVLAYPVISMDKEVTHMGTHDNLLGKNATEEEEAELSINNLITKSYPGAFYWCGKNDTSVPPENCFLLETALMQNGVESCFVLFADAPHGLGPGTNTAAEGWINRAVDFWMKNNIRE